MTDQDVMTRFESLGANCEFGIAQRMAGIEPPGLFRFAATPVDLLIRLLRDRFAGLGDDLEMWNRDGEWMTRDRTYNWSMHTWTRADEIDRDMMLTRETKRLAYLRGRILDLLTEASRTFVVVGCGAWGAEEVTCLLETYGPNRLLFVTEGRSSIVEIRPRLIHGTIPRFAATNIVDRDTDGAAWLRLCREAVDMLQDQYAGM